jgi:transposase
MPRHKGKVEAGVKYAQNNAVKRVAHSRVWLNKIAFLSDWERTVADTRIHGTTRQQVIKVFNDGGGPTRVAVAPASHGVPGL